MTPVPASSVERPSVNTVTKAFAAEYDPAEMKDATEETLMIRPDPRSFMVVAAAWERTRSATSSSTRTPYRLSVSAAISARREPVLATATMS